MSGKSKYIPPAIKWIGGVNSWRCAKEHSLVRCPWSGGDVDGVPGLTLSLTLEVGCGWSTYYVDAYGHWKSKMELYHCHGGGRLLVDLLDADANEKPKMELSHHHELGCWSTYWMTWLIHMCDMTHSYIWHDAFICVTWRIYMCHMTHSCFYQRDLRCVDVFLLWTFLYYTVCITPFCPPYPCSLFWVLCHLTAVLDWFEVDMSARQAYSFRVICVLLHFDLHVSALCCGYCATSQGCWTGLR